MTEVFDVAIVGLGVRGLADRPAAARARALGPADREGIASALRDRRVVLSPREPPPREPVPALRPRPDRAPRGLGNLAPGLSRDRLRSEARLHVLRARARAPLRRARRPGRPAPRGGEPQRRGRRHALVPRGLRPVPAARGAGVRRRVHGPHRDRVGVVRARRRRARDGPRRPPRAAPGEAPGGRVGSRRRPPPRARPGRGGVSRPARDGGSLHALRGRPTDRRDGTLRVGGAAAVSPRRCGAAPRVSRRLDLGPAVRQRRHERGRRRGAGPRPGAAPGGRRRRVGPSPRAAPDRPRPVRGVSAASPLRPPAPSSVPRRGRRRSGLGAPALRGRLRRPDSLDRFPADASRDRATGRSRRALVGSGSVRSWRRRSRETAAARSPRRTPPRSSSPRSTRPSTTSRSSPRSPTSTSRRRATRRRRAGSGGPRWREGSCPADHPTFGPALRECCASALEESGETRDALLARIRRAVEPLDVIGLSDEGGRRRNWYPVDADDLRAAAVKLRATPAEIEELIAKMSGPGGPTSASASDRPAGAAAPRPSVPAARPAPPR